MSTISTSARTCTPGKQRELDKLAAVCKAKGLMISDYDKMTSRIGVDAAGNGRVLWPGGMVSESLTVWELVDEYVASRPQPTVPADQPTAPAAKPAIDLKTIFGVGSSAKLAQAYVVEHGTAAYRALRVQAEAQGLL